MIRTGCLPLLLLPVMLLPGTLLAAHSLDGVNGRLAGQVIDHTNNHGADRRIWSAALGEWRSLYVYLPPGFDPGRHYPVILWMHGVYEDESSLLRPGRLETFDAAIAEGQLPPVIFVIPDGTVTGRPTLYGINPLWLNSQAGNFEDYLIQDVWAFAQQHYPIRPERDAHILAGMSGGAGAAFRLGIKYRAEFGVVFGIHPPLNTRWLDCHGRYFTPFDPNCWGWRTDLRRGREPVARFYGVVVIRLRQLVYPLYGRGPEAVAAISRENPIEMLDLYDLREGELAMYVAYTGRDQFNITAQVDSFLYRAQERGLSVGVGYDPEGRHDWASARTLYPGIIDWLATRLGWFATQD